VTLPLQRFGLLARAGLFLLVCCVSFAAPARVDESRTIGRIDFIAGQRNAMPPSNAAWQAHGLPMRWSSSAGVRQGLWLRLTFEVATAPTEGWGLLLQRLPSGGTVYLNGRMVADVPTDTDTQRVRWR